MEFLLDLEFEFGMQPAAPNRFRILSMSAAGRWSRSCSTHPNKPDSHSIFEFWLIPDHFSGPAEAAEHDAGRPHSKKWLWNFDPIVADFFFSRSRLRPGSLRIQKTCRSDFSSSASAESRKLSEIQACSAAESALKLVDLSRIGQIPVNSNSEVRRSTNWKFEKTREFAYLRSSRSNKPV